MNDLPSKISGGADVTGKMRRKDKKENVIEKYHNHNQKLQQTGQMADDESNDLF